MSRNSPRAVRRNAKVLHRNSVQSERHLQVLPRELSAERLLSSGQVTFVIMVTVLVGILCAANPLLGIGPSSKLLLTLAIALLIALSSATLYYKILQVLKAFPHKKATYDLDTLLNPPEGFRWPVFTVLIPLYREVESLPYIMENMRRMDYPKSKLDVRILIEENDLEIQAALEQMKLDDYVTVIICPNRSPRTKPSACNIGLEGARGEFVVIYDAEDIPEPLQLKKAAQTFMEAGPEVVCLQAPLQYHNPFTNILTQWFAAEYAFHFGVGLFGLERLGGPIPLGGTSNAFRMDALLELGGWDAYNVTEDADLGIRIARRGWLVRMIDSVTYEEANSQVHNWYRQRSRWIKGYYQTWLVHMRNPWRLYRELGAKRFAAFQLIIGYSTVSSVINPLFWATTTVYFYGKYQGDTPYTAYIDSLFPAAVLYLGIIGMVVGNLLAHYCLLIGSMEQGLFKSFWRMLLLPVYWILISAANIKALRQLASKKRRSYWELTKHALVARPEDAWIDTGTNPIGPNYEPRHANRSQPAPE